MRACRDGWMCEWRSEKGVVDNIECNYSTWCEFGLTEVTFEIGDAMISGEGGGESEPLALSALKGLTETKVYSPKP